MSKKVTKIIRETKKLDHFYLWETNKKFQSVEYYKVL